ncbi:hypothetical protein [Rudaeicoccus suwonensis]|uniref:Histidine phosphatase superfamily protein (Branch 1) n=1 Tax=Rudaeicoccus suwonensis TaxID=657409 RepID=A0A561E129_9MICO|nr:hypothetical protein [Rudaeicoccus suwonensis]TWE09309.1 hypothetical protein BKA23_3009 [Rudaeicoccus suwonensis]
MDHRIISSRRGVLTVVTATLASGSLAACASSAGDRRTSLQTAGAVAADDTVMIVRHAEKPEGGGAPYGVTAQGDVDAESLTVTGWSRAGALVGLFDPFDVNGPIEPRAGLQRPERLVAADPADGSARPVETLTPLSERLQISIESSWPKKSAATVAAALRSSRGATLVAWQHQDIPAIAEALGRSEPAVPSKWPGDRFDVVWVFRRRGSGWVFSQVPQLLLAGDRDTTI